MIEEKDRSAIVRLARQYGVQRVLLFGSGAEAGKPAGDIDLGIIGLDPARFFAFYGDLLFSLSKPVDVVDLSQDSRFNAIVKREGIPLYG
jgi:predicted nucleotidyltransferase